MSEVVYRSRVSVTREQGLLRSAVLPALDQPVLFGVHSAVAKHYGVGPEDQEPAHHHPRLPGCRSRRLTDGHLRGST